MRRACVCEVCVHVSVRCACVCEVRCACVCEVRYEVCVCVR